MKKISPFTIAVNKLLKNKLATLCFFVLLIELILIIGAPLFTSFDPNEVDTLNRLRPGFWAMNSGNY